MLCHAMACFAAQMDSISLLALAFTKFAIMTCLCLRRRRLTRPSLSSDGLAVVLAPQVAAAVEIGATVHQTRTASRSAWCRSAA